MIISHNKIVLMIINSQNDMTKKLVSYNVAI